MRKNDMGNAEVKSDSFVKHEGIISKITNEGIVVSLKGDISCQGCKAKAACGVSESNDKEITIFSTDTSFQLNDTVDVVLEKQLGLKAVFWAYIFPFILIVLTLIITSFFWSEWVSGVAALLILIPYYVMLFLYKASFEKAFQVSILKFNQ